MLIALLSLTLFSWTNPTDVNHTYTEIIFVAEHEKDTRGARLGPDATRVRVRLKPGRYVVKRQAFSNEGPIGELETTVIHVKPLKGATP